MNFASRFARGLGWLIIALAVRLPASCAGEVPAESGGVLTLEAAWQAALAHHPLLEAAAWEVAARRGAARQAGALPFPALELEFENFAGSGALAGTGEMEYTLGLAQTVPLGGKLGRTRRLAEAEVGLAELEAACQWVDLRLDVWRKYFAVAQAQERIALAEEDLTISRELAVAVGKQVAAGEVSPLDLARTEVESSRAEIEVARLRGEVEAARLALASLWGAGAPAFAGVEALATSLPSLPGIETLTDRFRRSPLVQLAGRTVDRERAALSLARAQWWPDLEVRGGWRKFRATGERALVAAVAIPLPVFARNQGGVREARARVYRSLALEQAQARERESALRGTERRARQLAAALRASTDTLLPAAARAFRGLRRGYELGEKSLLELLEAKRTLLDSRRTQLELTGAYLDLVCELEGLAPAIPENSKEKGN